jgi:isoleucyl-tRNA synthetase
MNLVRDFVTMGHAARVQAKLKVRQPLTAAVIINSPTKLSPEMQSIIAEELNVKFVHFADGVPIEWPHVENNGIILALDPNITEELRREGLVRELVRELQALRKQAGCKPGELVTFYYQTDDALITSVLEGEKTQLLEETTSTDLISSSTEQTVVQAVTVTVNNQPLWLGLVHV